MSVSRRGFFTTLSTPLQTVPTATLIAARGREAMASEATEAHLMEPRFVPPPAAGEIRLKSNENPLGPGKVAVEAIRTAFNQAGRYPFNARKSSSGLKEMLAKEFHAKPENIVLGAGSSEILRIAVRAFTSPQRPLVTADPSFENPVKTAELIGSPVKAVSVDREFRLDLDEMARASNGAGLVFLCNPNNPTATVHSFRAVAEFVSRLQRDSPQTAILIDEAYHDYVSAPRYRTAMRLAINRPGVFVSRTFSKAYGMAGLRVGYAVGQPETVRKLAGYKLNYDVNVLGIAAAMAAFNDRGHIAREKDRNTGVRDFTVGFFESVGLKATDGQTNFIFVNIGRPASEFREACQKYKVEVGRDFPPFEKTHTRISLGTMNEMERAVKVFQKVLAATTTHTSEPGRRKPVANAPSKSGL
ncbi:MAG: pyridoxal phosphate-dependent aminotransferase [Acidobacteriota bacterium]